MTVGHTDVTVKVVGSGWIQDIFWREKRLAEGLHVGDKGKDDSWRWGSSGW